MTSQELRRTNLRKLVAEFKTAISLAEAANTNEKYISQIISGTRNLGHQLARRFEDAAGKERGWLDYDHDSGGIVITRTDMKPDEAELLRLYRRANPTKKKLMIELGRLK
jgi:hypothetical protein